MTQKQPGSSHKLPDPPSTVLDWSIYAHHGVPISLRILDVQPRLSSRPAKWTMKSPSE